MNPGACGVVAIKNKRGGKRLRSAGVKMLRKVFNLFLLGSGLSGIDRDDPVARMDRMREEAASETDSLGEELGGDEPGDVLKQDGDGEATSAQCEATPSRNNIHS